MIIPIRIFICILIISALFHSKAQAQLNITALGPNPVCAGQSFNISYGANQAGTLSVHLYNGATDLKLTEINTLAGDNQAIRPTIPSNQVGGQYTVSLVNIVTSGGTSTSYTSGTIIVGVNSVPPLPVVTTPVTYCQKATPFPLSAIATASNNTLRWYGLDATGGSVSSTPTTPSTDQAGTFYYYVSQVNGNVCESNRAVISVTINPKPDKPITTPLSACYNAPIPPLIASGVTASGTLKWYMQETGGLPISTPILSTGTVGVVTYYVSQTNQFGCESDRAAITYTVNSLPPSPTIPAQTTLYCQNAVASPLLAISIPGATLNWYTVQLGGTAIPTLTPSTTDAFPKTYYVSQTDANGCETAQDRRASITITTVSNPALPSVNSPVAYCQGDNAIQLSATPTTTNTLRWYGTNFTGGTPTQTAPTPLTDIPGSTSYYVSQIDGNQCEGPRASIIVNVVAKPTPPGTTNVTVCQNVSASPVSLATGVTAIGTLKWYASQSGGTTISEPRLSIAAAGSSVVYYVSQTINGCESDRSPIQLIVKSLPDAPSVSSTPIIYCQNIVAQPLSATLTNGVRLNWYTVPTGGIASSSITPQTSLTTAAQSTTYYYVSQTNTDNCEGPRSSIIVIVNPKPAKPTVTASQTACQNTTSVTLSASGLNLKWYSDTTSSPVAMAPIIPTTSPGAFTYFVSQTDGNSCESYRASITTTIIPTPTQPTTTSVYYCLNTQPSALSAVASGSLNWYTASTGGTPSSTITPLTSSTGTITYYVSQSVNGCESIRASLDVTIRPLPPQPIVNVNPIPLCQNSLPTPLTATASGTLQWYTTASGGTASSTLIPQTTNTGSTPYFVSQIDGNGCESARTTVVVTVNSKPGRPTVATSQTACQGTASITFSASGSNLKWYNDASTLTVIATPTISTTTPGTFTYFVSQTDGNGCESDRASVTATVVATPILPTTTSLSICQNAQPAALTAIAIPGATLNWYTTATGGTPVSAITPLTTVVTTTTYYVSQSINGCEGLRASLNVTIRALPQQPTVSPNPVPLCQNSAPAPLTATASGTLLWYTTSSGGAALPSVIPLTSTPGLSAYYVTQTDANSCESTRTQVLVNVKARPAVPIVGTTAVTLCQSTPATALTAVAVGTQNWYTVPVDGTPTPSVIPSTTTTGQSTYYVSQTVDGCESARIPVVVTVQATPLVPTVSANPIYCQGSTGSVSPLSASAPNGGILTWYTQEIGGTGTSTPPVPPVNSAGTVTYYVSQSVNGCESQRVRLIATIKSPPEVPTIVPQVTACQNGTAVLTATLKGGASLNWYTVPTGGSASTVAPVPVTNSPGQFLYYVSQTDASGCESSRVSITVRVNPQPVAPSVSSVSFCQGVTATPLNVTPNGGTLNWYTTVTGGVASSASPIPNTASPTTTPYYVSLTDLNGCESGRSALLVTIAPTPAAPAVTTIAPVCQNSTPIVLTASGSNLKWYSDATSNTVSPSILQTTQAGTFNFFVSQTVNTCESPRALVTAVVNALPSAPGVVSNQTGCQDAVVQPLTATGSNLQWYDQNDNLISPPTPVTRVDVVQIYTYKVAQTINGCTSPKSTVQYTVNVTPVPSVVSPVSFCQNFVATSLQATGTNLKWYSPTGAVTANAPSPVTSTVSTGLSYSVSQTSTLGCESRKAEIKVTITALPTAKLDGNASIYLGGSAVLTMTLTGVGPYSYSLSEGTTGTIESATSVPTTVRSITVTPSATTTYTIASITNACGNGTTTGTASVTVRIPTVNTAALLSASVCSGSSFSVPFSTTGDFVLGNSFTVEIASITGDSSTRRYIPVSNPVVQGPGITASIPPTVAAGQYYVRVVAANGRYPISGTRSPTILTIKPLPTVSLTVNRKVVYNTEGVILYLTFTGDPSWAGNYAAESSTGSVTSPFSSTSNLLSIPVTPNVTTKYRLLNVTNTVCGTGIIAGADTATVSVQILTAAEDPLSHSVNVYPVPTDGAVTVDIDYPIQKQSLQLRLVGTDGRVIKDISTKQKQTILSLDKEPAGTYLLQITLGDRSTVRRILKR